MPTIKLQTVILASAEVVFDLSRSVDLHTISTAHTNERIVDGRTEGFMELHETVTWQAKHLGFTQKLSSKITAFERPNYFTDEMIKGAFTGFKHEHFFDYNTESGQTVMTDIFSYRSPLVFLGHLADFLFLKKYITQLLIQRNNVIKAFAEDEEKRKQILP